MDVKGVHWLDKVPASWAVHLRPFVLPQELLRNVLRNKGNDDAIHDEMEEDKAETCDEPLHQQANWIVTTGAADVDQ